jgi:ADP-heptose:LPS heptosyltransferase
MFLSSLSRKLWRWIYGLKCHLNDYMALYMLIIWNCAKHRKKAVLLCRFGAMGDVVCSLPLCQAVREKHPDCILIFVTAAGFKKIVEISGVADVVFGSNIWCWPFRFPSNFRFFGLVEEVFIPLNSDEREPGRGAMRHLIDDMADSCGLQLSDRQPRLFPDQALIRNTAIRFGSLESRKLLIAINGGPTWPVKMWSAENWQQLINRIHEEFDAEIFLLGQKQGERGGELISLRGVICLFDQVPPEQIAALLKNCDLLIAIDSGPLHIAGAVGTPVVGLFGANAAAFRLPPDSEGVGITANLTCISCQHKNPITHWKENCPHGIACMEAITVDQVFSAAAEILKSNPKAGICRKHGSEISIS